MNNCSNILSRLRGDPAQPNQRDSEPDRPNIPDLYIQSPVLQRPRNSEHRVVRDARQFVLPRRASPVPSGSSKISCNTYENIIWGQLGRPSQLPRNFHRGVGIDQTRPEPRNDECRESRVTVSDESRATLIGAASSRTLDSFSESLEVARQFRPHRKSHSSDSNDAEISRNRSDSPDPRKLHFRATADPSSVIQPRKAKIVTDCSSGAPIGASADAKTARTKAGHGDGVFKVPNAVTPRRANRSVRASSSADASKAGPSAQQPAQRVSWPPDSLSVEQLAALNSHQSIDADSAFGASAAAAAAAGFDERRPRKVQFRETVVRYREKRLSSKQRRTNQKKKKKTADKEKMPCNDFIAREGNDMLASSSIVVLPSCQIRYAGEKEPALVVNVPKAFRRLPPQPKMVKRVDYRLDCSGPLLMHPHRSDQPPKFCLETFAPFMGAYLPKAKQTRDEVANDNAVSSVSSNLTSDAASTSVSQALLPFNAKMNR